MTFCKGMCGRLYKRIRSPHSNYKYGPMCKTCQIRVETHDIVCRCCHSRFRVGSRQLSDLVTNVGICYGKKLVTPSGSHPRALPAGVSVKGDFFYKTLCGLYRTYCFICYFYVVLHHLLTVQYLFDPNSKLWQMQVHLS